MNKLTYEIVRSDRKSIAIVIDNEANLIVRAPRRAKVRDIANFVEQKKRWIEDKQHLASVVAAKYSPVVLENGESLPYLGNKYKVEKDNVPDVQLSGTSILIPYDCTKADLVTWLKDEAKMVFNDRASEYSRIMGTNYSCLKLSEAKARWGSCSAKNSLNFAWRLIMCPVSAIDYVVVHELGHIAHKNHGPAFWARVKSVLPNYKEQHDWLKANRKLMQII